MTRSTWKLLLASSSAALVFSACSDGTAPLSKPAMSAQVIQPATFTAINVAGATATLAFAINDSSVVVGRYVAAGRTHGYMRSAAGTFTTIDYPGAGFTVAGAINNSGDIVGWYTLPAAPSIRRGFLLRDGAFTSIDPPGATFTNVLGINDRGDIVGRYCTRTVCREPGSGDFHGFMLKDGEFINLDVPGSIETNAWKINNRGQIVGGFGPSAGVVEMFVLWKDERTTFALPNGKPLSEDNGGINARGDIVGKYCDVSPCLIGPAGHGFMLSNGQVTTIDIPGATGTASYGINAKREVVGGYFNANGALHGYLLKLETAGKGADK